MIELSPFVLDPAAAQLLDGTALDSEPPTNPRIQRLVDWFLRTADAKTSSPGE